MDQQLVTATEPIQVTEQDTDTSEIEQQLQQEAHQISETKKNYRMTPKFVLWAKLFTDKTNKVTYGNQTQSAMQAYQLDPDTQYYAAGTIGKENYRKLQEVGSRYLESQGITFGKMLDIAVTKMATTDKKEWYDEVAMHMGMPTHQPKAQQSLTQNNQYNVINITDPDAIQFNNELLKAIENIK
jgi:hypothetical protein